MWNKQLGAFVTLAMMVALIALGTIARADSSADAVFESLTQRNWEFRLEQWPSLGASVGDYSRSDQLADYSAAAYAKRYQHNQEVLQALEKIDRNKLSLANQVNAAIFARQIQRSINEYETKAYLIPLNSDWSFYHSLERLPASQRVQNSDDAKKYIRRLGEVDRVVDEHIALMQAGIDAGMVQPKVVLQGRDETIQRLARLDYANETFMAPLQHGNFALSASLTEQAANTIANEIVPAFGRLLKFFNESYVPAARDSLAAQALPGGERFYDDQVAYYTTLDLAPSEIHAIGLQEVAKLKQQMEDVIAAVKFEGDLQAFINHLRTDPAFYAKTEEELLRYASRISKRMDGALPQLFSVLPRQPYGVEPVPASIAETFTAGRYISAPIDSTRPGLYWVNTSKLDSRPMYALPALTLHEAVPGHHLQNALAQEQGDQPDYRRTDYISAYGEGWALYSEFLGVEVGIYETPYEEFGRLTYAMWRACRLVIDTGIHAMGWSREKAVDYLANHTALSLHEVNTEIDRYISWPAQALSYKLGEITIRELRAEAETALGEQFDIRAFHDAILAQGSVPLPILRAAIEDWIQGQNSAN